MLKFCEKTIKAKSEAVLALKPEIDAAVDKLCSDGYDNLFLVGIGGTYASGMEIEAYMRGHKSLFGKCSGFTSAGPFRINRTVACAYNICDREYARGCCSS